MADHADPDEMMRAAIAARRRGDEGEALALFRRLVARLPDHAAANNALGMNALGERRFVEARDHFARAAAADAAAPALWINLATAERELGDTESERRALLGALAADQRHLMALIRLAELHERQDEPGEALQRWSDVLAAAAAMEERSPALEAIVARASRFVADRSAATLRSVEAALAVVPGGATGGRRRVDAAIDAMFGRRSIYTNVCSGLHVPFLPADEYFDRAALPFLSGIEAATADIREELLQLIAVDGAFRPYVELPPGTPDTIWSPLDGSLDWGAVHLWRHGERVEEMCARCPRTAAAIEALPLAHVAARMPTVFFSLLQPRTHIPPHTGVSNMRAIVHLPLIVPPGCRFRVGGETRAWREGETLIFDDTIEHEAWNDSASPRAVLIFDIWNPHLSPEERALLQAFFDAVDRDAAGPGRATASF